MGRMGRKGIEGRRLGGALTSLGVLITFWSRNLWVGVPLLLVGVILVIWAWNLD